MPSSTFPDAAGAFTLDLAQAAAVLATTPETLIDLIASGCAFALAVPTWATTARPPLMMSPGLVAELRRDLETRDDERRAAEVRAISEVMRAYLAEHEPTVVYADALHSGDPLLARDRKRRYRAHLRESTLVDMVRAEPRELAGPSPTGKLALPNRIASVLEQMGFERVVGIRPPGDTRQHWEVWYRLPAWMWSEAGGVPLGDLPPFRLPEHDMSPVSGRPGTYRA